MILLHNNICMCSCLFRLYKQETINLALNLQLALVRNNKNIEAFFVFFCINLLYDRFSFLCIFFNVCMYLCLCTLTLAANCAKEKPTIQNI